MKRKIKRLMVKMGFLENPFCKGRYNPHYPIESSVLSKKDSLGKINESPYREFVEGDSVKVSYDASMPREAPVYRMLGEDGVFIRDGYAFDSNKFCPYHDVDKIIDDEINEGYCPVCMRNND